MIVQLCTYLEDVFLRVLVWNNELFHEHDTVIGLSWSFPLRAYLHVSWGSDSHLQPCHRLQLAQPPWPSLDCSLASSIRMLTVTIVRCISMEQQKPAVVHMREARTYHSGVIQHSADVKGSRAVLVAGIVLQGCKGHLVTIIESRSADHRAAVGGHTHHRHSQRTSHPTVLLQAVLNRFAICCHRQASALG